MATRSGRGVRLGLCLATLALGVACSDDDGSELSGRAGAGGNAGSSGNGGASGGAGGLILLDAGGGQAGTSDGGGGACATSNAKTELEPVFLAFAFDVSGSMGQLDFPWHDPELKWKPVVAATEQFFEAQTSKGISASLRFFPDKNDDVECTETPYRTPEVGMTSLPSPLFRAAINVVDTENKTAWRGGTPTVYVVKGTISYVKARRTATPGRYAIVLVTDGYPQGCGASNTIANVVTDVTAAKTDGISTYVIGVLNPNIEGAPRTLTDLDDVALAGNGGKAIIIDTGNPTQTSANLLTEINNIRKRSISCTLPIPAPPGGKTFDKEKIEVEYKNGAGTTAKLTYDQTCAAQNAWHYDNPASPKQITLCDATCATVRADTAANLSVNFTCNSVIDIPE